ncbi:MAG: DUF6714 family protein [Polyangia bacterium]
MQIAETTKDALRAQIHAAFDAVPIPARTEEMRLPRYTGEDSYEMASALVGKHWSTIPIKELFYHREMLGTLSAAAYRAYLPAYLEACLATEDPYDKYGADLRGYLLSTLKHWPHQRGEHRAAEVRERLSLLDGPQRAAVASVLRYLETRWQMAEATEILREWPG